MFDRKTISDKISATLSKLADDVDAAAGNDYRRYMSRVAPGDTIEPKDGTIRTDEGRDECSCIIDAAKERIREICDQARDEALTEMAEAPSPAATAFIAGLEARDKVSADELVAGLRAYGDNWTAYNAMMALVKREEARQKTIIPINVSNTLEGATDYIDGARASASTTISNCFRNPTKPDTEGLRLRVSFFQYLGEIM